MMMCNKASQNVRIILVCFLCLFILGCREQPDKDTNNSSQHAKREFYIGLVPEHNIFRQRDRYEPLAMYLSKKVGIKVELRISNKYENIVDRLWPMDLDAAFLGSFTAAEALNKVGAQPIARPQYHDGSSTYYGMIFVRKDSNISSAQDMKDKRFAFVDKATTAGWLLPLHYFKENNINDPASWLGEIYFTGTHEDAIYDVLERKADVGAAKNTVFSRLAEEDKRLNDELTILATSPEVPANTLMIRPHIDETIVTDLREALLTMHQDREGIKALHNLGAEKFIETFVKDFDPVFEYAIKLGIDLSQYDKQDN